MDGTNRTSIIIGVMAIVIVALGGIVIGMQVAPSAEVTAATAATSSTTEPGALLAPEIVVEELEVPAAGFTDEELMSHACRWIRQIDAAIDQELRDQEDTLTGGGDLDLTFQPPPRSTLIAGPSSLLLERAGLVAMTAALRNDDLYNDAAPLARLAASYAGFDRGQFYAEIDTSDEVRDELLRVAVVTCTRW